MSKFHTLMGTLLDYFLLFVLRMIGNMSSPIYEHYRCAPSRQHQPGSLWKTDSMQESEPAPSIEQRTGTENLLLDSLEPEPLANMLNSLQLMAINVVNQMQTALKKRVTSKATTPHAAMPGLDSFHQCGPSSSCYFFIDLRNTTSRFMDSQEEFSNNSSHISNDKNNNADDTADSPAKKSMQRQRSISECSDNSFDICFEEDDASSVQPTACSDDDDFEESEMCECSHDSSTANRKVRFNLNPEVHVMLAWDFAYRAARKSEWQVMARDRFRFQQRIHRVAPILNPILTPNHREQVYKARFLNVE